jgi:phospholipase/lecithinase/hemolysin
MHPAPQQAAATLLLLVAALAAANLILKAGGSAATPSLVVFGDSLSDTGNYLELTGGLYPDPMWYKDGHSSGGGMWPEYLAQYFQVPLQNYAYYGATACPTPDYSDVTGLPTRTELVRG